MKNCWTESNKTEYTPSPIILVGIILGEMGVHVHQKMCQRMFTALLFVLHETENNLHVQQENG